MSERALTRYTAEKGARKTKSLWKGIVAGLIAGVAATAVKIVAEKVYPPRKHGELGPTEALAEKLAGRELDAEARRSAGRAITWGIGAAAGAAYGAVAEYFPEATDKEGASFGLMLMALTHETALPAMGVEAAAEKQTTREHTSEAASHVIFGVVAERVRRIVRHIVN